MTRVRNVMPYSPVPDAAVAGEADDFIRFARIVESGSRELEGVGFGVGRPSLETQKTIALVPESPTTERNGNRLSIFLGSMEK